MRGSSSARRSIIITNNNNNHDHDHDHNDTTHAAWGVVSRVTTMEYMFLYALPFNQDISTWDGK